MRNAFIAANVVGLIFCAILVFFWFVLPARVDTPVLAITLTFMPFVLGFIAYHRPDSAMARAGAITANIVAVILYSAVAVIVVRDGSRIALGMALSVVMMVLIPCAVNLVFLFRRRPAQPPAS
jgi:hypothetical protein